MRLRRFTAAVALATAAAVPAAAAPAWAGKPPPVSTFGKIPVAPSNPATAFTVSGTAGAVSVTGRTLTVKPAKGATVTIGVPASATVVVNKATGKSLSDVAAGATVTVTGTQTGTTYTATRVEASGKLNTVTGKIP